MKLPARHSFAAAASNNAPSQILEAAISRVRSIQRPDPHIVLRVTGLRNRHLCTYQRLTCIDLWPEPPELLTKFRLRRQANGATTCLSHICIRRNQLGPCLYAPP
eukprot:6194091-Pleurochrysis_carterae.AAC.1